MNNEIIMDFSIHDAIKAGFNKIVFVIRPDIESDSKERIGDRVEEICGKLNVEVLYTFQDIHSTPGDIPEGRTKPWGTGQAVLSAKSLIHEPFAVINADDYYIYCSEENKRSSKVNSDCCDFKCFHTFTFD